jgi:hypothetical protein
VQITVAAEYLARSIGAIALAPVEVIVTAPPEIVVSPTPIDCTLICSPAANTPVGIVIVTAEPLEEVTSFPESPATRVYVVPVCSLKARLTIGAVKVLLVKVCAVVKSAVTAVLIDIVPEFVIVPPDKPVPAVTLLTVPVAA